ncbi:MAG: hypothetical protein A2849_03535 [Candidatus Taylorbacteria bacterium RIFCSPHIGHO2_01_FULL_51_15]|uniref:Transglycosylase SLT domain-containing protein n=1 Tax=Candidatus Taylorbacteria bacterium RIFCSPHIGHO2_01_FULL_51_15 TaxID=1802304 RepID=A0A1G2MAS5_9BACT|nr:MAG: hypothetical protein A2849_03535 [Candidatus Taylorbacteria bacterium RIFCSPHIGHO2_01_FULL_51_15]
MQPTVAGVVFAMVLAMALIPFSVLTLHAQTAADVLTHRQQLEKQLADLEAQIAVQQNLLKQKQGESESLKRDIAILDAKITSAKLSIKARDIAIQNLTGDIGEKQTTINGLNEKLQREKLSLAQLIRKTNEIDNRPPIAVLLGEGSLSDVFEELDTFSTVQKALKDSFVVIDDTKATTLEQKNALEDKRAEEQQLRQLQVLEQQKIQVQEREKQKILKDSKGQEAIYQKIIFSTQKTAAQIRSELFTLTGSAAIPFEKALEYAKHAEAATGVRAAFILGIIAEESNLGENIGTGTWRVDMKAPRDTEPFLRITASLGLNPDTMPVSKKPWYGWGGAMGPAQFIPSTWVLYEDRIAKATGHNPPSPWNPEDAFAAAAILLKDNGAARGTFAAERLAALRYLAGWVNASKPAYAFYGDDVMELAEKYQQQINVLLARAN